MAKLKHYLEYAGSKSLALVAKSLPPETADKFGAALGTLAFHLMNSRRRISNNNIRETIGRSFSNSEIDYLTKKVFQNIGRTLIELAQFEKLGRDGLARIIQGDTTIIRRVHEAGKGAIILTCHYGNWEMLGGWPAMLGYETDFLVGTQHNPLVDEQLNSFRKNLGVGIISLENSLRGIFKALKANHFVGIAADQHSASGIKLKFLGKDALHARGPALFSIRTGAAVCPMMLRRESFDRHVVHAAEPIFPQLHNDEEKEIERITRTANDFFEDFIRKYPDQWAWTHRRWKVQSN